jgi:hypothetical protein
MTRCRTGKRTYRDEEQAKAALTRIRQGSEKRAETPTRYYECEFCTKFHLTSATSKGPVRGEWEGGGRPPRNAPKPPTPSTPEQEIATLESIIDSCIASGCGSCMHSAAWGAYRIRKGLA